MVLIPSLLILTNSPSRSMPRIHVRESLMAEWLEQVSQRHGMYWHDLEVTSSHPSQVELEVLGTSALSRT